MTRTLTPIKVSPTWRVVPRSRPIVEAAQRPLWREALVPERPISPADWRREAPAPQPYLDDYEVPTGRYAAGATRYTRPASVRQRPHAGPDRDLPFES